MCMFMHIYICIYLDIYIYTHETTLGAVTRRSTRSMKIIQDEKSDGSDEGGSHKSDRSDDSTNNQDLKHTVSTYKYTFIYVHKRNIYFYIYGYVYVFVCMCIYLYTYLK
jgi:hypothetical protein